MVYKWSNLLPSERRKLTKKYRQQKNIVFHLVTCPGPSLQQEKKKKDEAIQEKLLK